MRTGLILSGTFLVLLWMGLNPRPAPATVEIGKQTKKACTVCHIKTGSKDLNEAGKYFLEKKTLDGFVAKESKEVKK